MIMTSQQAKELVKQLDMQRIKDCLFVYYIWCFWLAWNLAFAVFDTMVGSYWFAIFMLIMAFACQWFALEAYKEAKMYQTLITEDK